ncbi:Hypothetical protein, putative [Bodo saltans]|uniref:Globin domain-containing protein n=1 Tax=Bodo saltans TaxID=75058 RepID=A0A0S4IY03_BODSA|nr:Hypothetical protein, putative [Bodo saltans]|eukprot:CUG07473.1 Hypothetical protein, putative [Bodo saltans]
MSSLPVVFVGSVCLLVEHNNGQEMVMSVVLRPKRSQQRCDFASLDHTNTDVTVSEGEYRHSVVLGSHSPRTPNFAPIVIFADPQIPVPEDVDPNFVPRTASAALEEARKELQQEDATTQLGSSQALATTVAVASVAAPFQLPLSIEVSCTTSSKASYFSTIAAPSLDALTLHDLSLVLHRQDDAEAAPIHCCLRLLDLSFAVVPTLLAPWSDPSPVEGGVAQISDYLQKSIKKVLAAGTRVPYGIMPLYTLYDHAVFFARALCGPLAAHCRAIPTLRRIFGQTTSLKGPLCCVVPHPSPVAHRWELLKDLDCTTVILGDAGFAPLAVVLTCCRGLRRLIVNQNNLSLPSAKRLVVAVRSGLGGLQELYLSGNQFFELGGEELLRLLKGDAGCLGLLDVANNGFSDRLLSRFDTLSRAVSNQIVEDPLNAMSSRFDYLVHMDALPPQCWEQVEPLWRMLTVAPPLPPGLSGSPSPGIPVAAAAPLLSEIVRSVFVEVAKERQDPAIRIVFGPIGSYVQDNLQPADSVFSPGSSTSMSADTMYLQSYVKMLVTTLRVALDAPMHWDDAVQTLRCIGAQHDRNGVDAALYCAANRCLLKALEAHIPDDTLSPNVKAAVIQVLALMTRSTVGGMTQIV